MSLANADVVLTTSAIALFGPGMSPTALILKATACNTDASAHTISVYRVPMGGTAGATNILIDQLSIPALSTVALILSGQTLYQGQTLQALASAGAVVNLSVSYSGQ